MLANIHYLLGSSLGDQHLIYTVIHILCLNPTKYLTIVMFIFFFFNMWIIANCYGWYIMYENIFKCLLIGQICYYKTIYRRDVIS